MSVPFCREHYSADFSRKVHKEITVWGRWYFWSITVLSLFGMYPGVQPTAVQSCVMWRGVVRDNRSLDTTASVCRLWCFQGALASDLGVNMTELSISLEIFKQWWFPRLREKHSYFESTYYYGNIQHKQRTNTLSSLLDCGKKFFQYWSTIEEPTLHNL